MEKKIYVCSGALPSLYTAACMVCTCAVCAPFWFQYLVIVRLKGKRFMTESSEVSRLLSLQQYSVKFKYEKHLRHARALKSNIWRNGPALKRILPYFSCSRLVQWSKISECSMLPQPKTGECIWSQVLGNSPFMTALFHLTRWLCFERLGQLK